MNVAESAAGASDDLAEIDAFCDTLWLEDGLAKTSLASYRSDLMHLSHWLKQEKLAALCRVCKPGGLVSAV